MQTFKFSFVLRTRENTDVFITFDENIYDTPNKRVNNLYLCSISMKIILRYSVGVLLSPFST